MNVRHMPALAFLLLVAGAATAQAQYGPGGYGYMPTHPPAYGQGSPQMFGLPPGMPTMGPAGNPGMPPHAFPPEAPYQQGPMQQASFGGKKKGHAGGCGGCGNGGCHGACGSCCGACDDCCGSCEPECPVYIPYVPNMLGDSLGIPRVLNNTVTVPRHLIKVADNNSVRPETRLSIGYNLFAEVPTRVNPAGQVLNRRELQEMKLVGEAAFLDGRASFQLIVPLYHTVELYQPGAPPMTDELDFELGRVTGGIKGLIFEADKWCASAGCLVETPTMEDIRVADQRFREDSLYITPWVGCEVTPNATFFAQCFVSGRFNTKDAPLLTNNVEVPNNGIREQDILMLDLQLGAWLWRNKCEGCVMGIAPTVELHYTTTLADDIRPTTINSLLYGRVDQLNCTPALNFEFGNASTLGVGCALPLRQKTFPGGTLNTDAMFDWELIVQWNQYW